MFDAIVLLLYVNVVGVSNGIVARMDWERSPTGHRAGSVGVFSFRGDTKWLYLRSNILQRSIYSELWTIMKKWRFFWLYIEWEKENHYRSFKRTIFFGSCNCRGQVFS